MLSQYTSRNYVIAPERIESRTMSIIYPNGNKYVLKAGDYDGTHVSQDFNHKCWVPRDSVPVRVRFTVHGVNDTIRNQIRVQMKANKPLRPDKNRGPLLFHGKTFDLKYGTGGDATYYFAERPPILGRDLPESAYFQLERLDGKTVPCNDVDHSNPSRRTVYLERQKIIEGNIPYAAPYPAFGRVEGYLSEISLPQLGRVYYLHFVKPNRSTTECGDSSAVVSLKSGQTSTQDDLKEIFGRTRPRFPLTFVACLTSSGQPPQRVPINIEVVRD